MSKRVLITGCSTGIGRALAETLAARGHEVIATARSVSQLDDLDVTQKIALDVTDPTSVNSAADAVGTIDVLVNNAGVTVWGGADSPPDEEIRRVFETNVFGMIRMTRAILPGMRARRSGLIVQISSAAAKRATAMLGHYAASKAALEAYSEAMRIELNEFGIGVCIVALGPVESNFGVNRREVITPEYEALAAKFKARIGRSRKSVSTPEDVATRIADLIEASEPPLRVDGTGDAFALVAERTSLSDADWEAKTLRDIWAPAPD